MRTNLTASIVVTLALTGCVSLRAKRVETTRSEGDVKPCKFVGDVSGRKFLEEAADLGGDVVLMHATAFGVAGKDHPFKAYDCGGRYGGRAAPASREKEAPSPAEPPPAPGTSAPPPATK